MSENKITIEEAKTKKEFKVDQYIPFGTKLFIVDKVIKECTEEINGVTKINYANKRFLIDTYLIMLCTNIEMPDEIDIELYDELKSSGIISTLYEKLNQSDYYELMDIIDSELEQKLTQLNSVEMLIQGQLVRVVDKATELLTEKTIKSLLSYGVKQINKIDKNVLVENSGLIKGVIDIFKKNSKTE